MIDVSGLELAIPDKGTFIHSPSLSLLSSSVHSPLPLAMFAKVSDKFHHRKTQSKANNNAAPAITTATAPAPSGPASPSTFKQQTPQPHIAEGFVFVLSVNSS